MPEGFDVSQSSLGLIAAVYRSYPLRWVGVSRIGQLYRKIKDTCLQGYLLLRITMNFACH